MLQISPFPFVPDFDVSDGVTVPRIDVVDNDGERSCLHTTVDVKGKIRVALGFRRLMQSGNHDDCRDFFRPDHPPEVGYCVS